MLTAPSFAITSQTTLQILLVVSIFNLGPGHDYDAYSTRFGSVLSGRTLGIFFWGVEVRWTLLQILKNWENQNFYPLSVQNFGGSIDPTDPPLASSLGTINSYSFSLYYEVELDSSGIVYALCNL